jgi:hypothetical protein
MPRRAATACTPRSSWIPWRVDPATRGVNEGIERSASLLRIVRRQELLDCLPMLVARRFDAA